MKDILFIIATFWKVLAANPGQLLPFLAYACAATMVVAVVSDALLRKRRTPAKQMLANKDDLAGR